jgi:Tfp pilus assembly protein FimT
MQVRIADRKALTLMELVVVLTVLAVMGGLIVAILPNYMKRTHLAKCSDTIAQLNSTWMRAYAQNIRYPDVCDSLLDSSGSNLSIHLTSGLTSQASPYPLKAADVLALRRVGITRVVDLASVPADGNVTYDSAPLGSTARVLATGSNVAELNLSAHVAAGNQLSLKRHLVRRLDGSMADNSANVRYLLFGIGPNCSAVGTGKMIQEAPVHFGATDEINPSNVYQRYLVVLSLVSNTDGTVTAYFEAAAGNDTGGPSSVEGHIRQFHDHSSQEG